MAIDVDIDGGTKRYTGIIRGSNFTSLVSRNASTYFYICAVVYGILRNGLIRLID